MTNFTYSEGDTISFNAGVVGTGVVRGAGPSLPGAGVMYIIEVTSTTSAVTIPNEQYPFSHMFVFETQMEKM